jgi:uncharacterized protein (DUF488 family)
MEPPTIFTVGHGNRAITELIGILQSAGIATLVDIRATPHSTRFPQYEQEALRAAIAAAGMVYHWAGRQLGGRRAPAETSRHSALEDPTERGFADHMDGGDFRQGAAQLTRLAGRAPVAILCAEKNPQHCHRSLIADYLTLQGVRVVHLLDPGISSDHLLNARVRRESADLVYDRYVTDPLPGL